MPTRSGSDYSPMASALIHCEQLVEADTRLKAIRDLLVLEFQEHLRPRSGRKSRCWLKRCFANEGQDALARGDHILDLRECQSTGRHPRRQMVTLAYAMHFKASSIYRSG